MKGVKYMKICFEMKYLISMFLKSSFEHVHKFILEKSNLARLYSQTCFCCHYEILKNNDFLRRAGGNSLTCILLPSVFTKRYKHDLSLGKQKPSHKAINRRSRNLRMATKSYF